MIFSKDNLPELGQRVIIGDDTNGVRTGIVFGILKRYKLDPLILVDIKSVCADKMDHAFGEYLERVSPYLCRTSLLTVDSTNN